MRLRKVADGCVRTGLGVVAPTLRRAMARASPASNERRAMAARVCCSVLAAKTSQVSRPANSATGRRIRRQVVDKSLMVVVIAFIR